MVDIYHILAAKFKLTNETALSLTESIR